jgi:hypothetical protein
MQLPIACQPVLETCTLSFVYHYNTVNNMKYLINEKKIDKHYTGIYSLHTLKINVFVDVTSKVKFKITKQN